MRPPSWRLAAAALAALFSATLAEPCLAAPGAKTIVQRRNDALKRLHPLLKATVGPDDQYAAAVDPQGRWLAFSHKSNLAPHLRLQNLKTGDSVDLLPVTADSQEPSFSPSGRLAFSYYRLNARGDVCWTPAPLQEARTLSESDFKCLPRSADEADSERANPFWASDDEIGYVSRPIAGGARKIMAQNVRTGALRTLAQGQVWAPAMKPGGRWLVYNEIVDPGGPSVARRALTLQDLASGKKTPVFVELPGFSGFPSISPDEKHVYFSHFLNDTNADNAVDGGDNAVVFRLPIAAAAAADGKDVFPEQLTSVESSCSFPRAFGDRLYATCAFEGSLDVYSLPESGAVPADWSETALKAALRTSRSYQDRILLWNAIRFRGFASALDADARLFANHLLADDSSAALYYLSRVEQGAPAADRAFWGLLRLHLRARSLAKAQPSDEPSRDFRRAILAIDRQASGDGAGPAKKAGADFAEDEAFRAVVRGHLRAALRETNEARSLFRQATALFARAPRTRPLERALWHELALKALDARASGSAAKPVDEAYKAMLTAPELEEEERVYYAFQWLRTAEEAEKTADRRVARIRGFSAELAHAGLKANDPAALLLASEEVALRLTLEKDDPAKLKAWNELDRLMIQTQSDYFLRRATYVRAILTFTSAAEFKYMSLVAGAWLKYTSQEDLEYAYARDVFSRASLEEGYGYQAAAKPLIAVGFFYQSLSLTDDLESHYAYVLASAALGERKDLDVRYRNLANREFIGDNMKYVEALLALLDGDRPAAQGAAGAAGQPTEALDRALAKLRAMQQDRESPTRRLLIGYCLSAKLLRTANGMEFDAGLFEDAHRELTLAYDVGRANERVAAAALTNLGLLHERAQNHALAARFFALRKRYPFASNEERVRVQAALAQALYRSRQADSAADELAAALAPDKPSPTAAAPDALRERFAFYSMAAGRYADAARAYAELWPRVQRSSDGRSSDGNLARIGLAYGFAKLMASPGASSEARALLTQAADRASRLQAVGKGGDRLIDFDPARVRLAALGLLARTGSPQERIRALEARAELLERARKSVDDWRASRAQARAQLAGLRLKANDVAQARAQMEGAVEDALASAESAGFLSQTAYRTAANALSLALLRKGEVAYVDAKPLRRLVESCLKSYDGLKASTPQLDLQRAKLAALWAAYEGGGPAKVQAALSTEGALRSKAALPEAWAEVEALAKAAQ